MSSDGTLKFDTLIDSDGFQKGISSIGDIAHKGLEATGNILKGTMTAIGGIGAASIKVGSDFESGMSKVAAISGASSQELAELTEKAKHMGATTKFSATESAEAFEYMAMAGWKTEDMLGGIEGIMNLAAASGEELATTSDIITDALTAFGMKANDSGHFADILAAASSNANTNVAMMGETFKYVAPVAGTLGFSAEDTALAIGLMANSGIKASQAGTSLRGALTRLVKPTDDMQATMVELGLAVQQTEHVIDNSKIDKLQGKVADRTAAMEKAQISYNSAVSKYGADSAQAQKAAINLEKAQRKLAETSGDLSTAQAGSNKVVGITNTLMTDGSGKMKSFYDVMVSLRKSFKGMTEEQKAQAAATLFGQEAMSGMLAIIDASDQDFEKLAGSIKDCDGSAEEMAEIMQNNLQGQITILESGLEGLGISFYENMQAPCMDIVKEAQSMVQELQEAFNEGSFESLVTTAGNILSHIVEKIAAAAPDLIGAATGLISSFCESLKSSTTIGDAASSLITSLVTGFFSCADDIWTTAIVLAGKMADGLAAGAPEMVQSVAQCVADIVESIADWLPDLLQAGVDIILSVADGIAQTIPTLITQAANILITIGEALVQNLPVIVEAALNIVQALIDGLVSGLPLLIAGATQLFMGIIEALPTVIEQLLQALPELITTIINFFTENIPLIIDGAIQLLMGIIDAIPTIIQAIVENLPQIITALVEGLVGALPQLLEAAITLLMALIEAIPQIVVAIAENLPQIITAIVTGLVNAIPTIFSTAKDLLWNIITAIPEIVAGLAEAVPNIISGIVNGLLGGIGAVKDAAISLGGGILDGIKGFFGIHSPSTVMEEQGDYLVKGLTNGLASMPDEMQQYLNQTATQVEVWGQQLLNTVRVSVQNAVNATTTIFSQLPGKVWTWLSNTLTRVQQFATTLLARMSSAALNAINKFMQWMQQLPGKVATVLNQVIAKAVQFATEFAAKATAAAKGFCDNLINGMKTLPASMEDVGKNIVHGLWEGISSEWKWLEEQVKSLAESLLKETKASLKIESPSKAFEKEVGEWIPPGIGKGIKNAMPDLQRQVDSEMNELAARMQTAVAIETGGITVRTKARAEHNANTEIPKGGGDTYIDQHIEQENHYNVPVASPAEISKSQREAARKLLGGVK